MTLWWPAQPTPFRVAADAPIFLRLGDERTATASGEWIGGEFIDFRAVSGRDPDAGLPAQFRDAVRRPLFAAGDLAGAQDQAGARHRVPVVQHRRDPAPAGGRARRIGPAHYDRDCRHGGVATVRALRLRSLLGLRDSLVTFDEERNASGSLLGVTFYGQGWGHGVGMCQVGAYGMAMAGATHEQILTKYYTGIALTKTY